MAEVVTFMHYLPPARFDAIPWTEVRVEESDTEEGTYVEIDAITLSPVDADPSDPAYRDFTTELGTAAEYWYRIRFADATGDTSQATNPIQNLAAVTVPDVVAYGTVDELARILKLRAPTAAQELAMTRVLEAAALEIDSEIGLDAPYADPPQLVIEVNLERAVEHWAQQEMSFGIIGLGDAGAIRTSTNTWDRHAAKLAPLKQRWGIS